VGRRPAAQRPLTRVVLLLAGVLCLILGVAACAPAAPPPTAVPGVPAGLDPGHALLVIDELGGPTVVMDTFDPRSVTLYADGTLIASDPGRNLMLSTVSTTLGPDALGEAWATVVGSGLAVDRLLELPGIADAGTTRVTIDDGTTVTRLQVYGLGLDSVNGEPTFPPAEAALRANTSRAVGLLRGTAGKEPYVPPALLLWWGAHEEAPSGMQPRLAAWTAPVDLATAGVGTRNVPLYGRCVRLDGEAASAVAALVNTLSPQTIVEQAGIRYAIAVRPIYPDEGAAVTCPGS
jgi:hypothetical protein